MEVKDRDGKGREHMTRVDQWVGKRHQITELINTTIGDLDFGLLTLNA